MDRASGDGVGPSNEGFGLLVSEVHANPGLRLSSIGSLVGAGHACEIRELSPALLGVHAWSVTVEL